MVDFPAALVQACLQGGRVDRFLAILAEYRQAKEVTRRRLYLEAIGEVLPSVKNVYIVDEAQQALVPWLSLGPGAPAAAMPAKGGPKPWGNNGNATLILTTESDFYRYLKQATERRR